MRFSIAFDAGPRASRRERAHDPRVTLAAVNAENVVMVLTGLGRGDRFDAVVIPKMGDQTLDNRPMRHPGLEAFEVGQRLG